MNSEQKLKKKQDKVNNADSAFIFLGPRGPHGIPSLVS